MKFHILTIVVLLLMSCGNDTKTKTTTTKSNQTEIPKKKVVTTEGASAVLELAGNDQMKFDKSELKVKAGQKVTLNFKHTGKMSKDVMGHNFVLLKQGTDLADFATKAVKAKDNDYIPAGDEVIVHTKVLGGGENTSITFDAPEKGTYDFICSFPGHYSMMKGKFIVE